MKFESTNKVDLWVKRHSKSCHSSATAGEHYSYIFTPTGLGDVVRVKCLVCGAEFVSYENL